MNPTHLHLLINHLPIFGSLFGGLVLAYGLWAKSNQTKIAAYYLLIISSIGAVIAYVSGDAAEDVVENIPGISKAILDQHEDASVFALAALIILGIVSLVGLFLTIKNLSFVRQIAFVTLFISLISFGIIARVGYLGGQIRHTEINSPPATPQQEGVKQHNH
ncbi:MAG: hypothetical protein IPP77_01355 [Bacteroidetes bacterium]|nr:hypothetical protein [Bacteroidota bacterium]